MSEVYLEQMVKEEKTGKGIALRIAMILGALLICFLAFISPWRQYIFVFALTVSCIGILLLWRRVMREYEYIFTEGQLDVDVIFSRVARKHLLSIDCRKFQLIAPAGEPKYQKIFEQKYGKTIDAGRGKINENTYIAIAKKEDKTLKLIFEPNERMIEAIKKYSPRNTMIAGGLAKPISMD